MSEYAVSIKGILAQGRHGSNPGERDFAQDFVVDLYVTVGDVGTDSLDETADYAALALVAREVVERESFVLLEMLAEAVARAVFGYPKVVRVVAVVHKPAAAESLGVDDVCAEAVVG